MRETSRQRKLPVVSCLCCWLLVGYGGTLGLAGQQSVPGPNVNVTGGPAFLTLDPFDIVGDPWRNQSVESHCAVSSRNPAVLFCSAVDYRLVDLPGGADGVHNDSWNMVAQSIDGAQTWLSRLHPGHPLDPAPNVLSAYDFAADPLVQAGAAGIFYHAGLVADRRDDKPGRGPPNAPGAIYLSTWIHLTDQEDDPEPIRLVENGISIPARGNAGQFHDRPHLAVGTPTGRTCTFDVRRRDGALVTQTVPATPVFLAFTTFVGGGPNAKTKIQFTSSQDCGRTWSNLTKVTTATASINVGVQIVPIPGSQRVLLFWRRGAFRKDSDAIMVATSNDSGKTFSKPRELVEICPFDQLTSETTFRARTVPSAVGDSERAYVVWSDRRNPATGSCTTPDGLLADARVLLATTADGVSRSAPRAVDDHAGRGHQLFPVVSAAAGSVHVAWLDFRNDASGVFQELIDEGPIVANDPSVLPPGVRQRHTADLFASEARAAQTPAFASSRQVSQYIFGRPAEEPDSLIQLQWNVVNPRNFDRMTDPFLGDYNSIAAEWFQPKDPVLEPGAWTVNGAPDSPPSSPTFHTFWTDARNLKLLSDEDYSVPRPFTPPDLNTAIVGGGLPPESLFDPALLRPLCDPDLTGTKNLDIYGSRSTHGFYSFAPWNNKAMRTPDGESVQRAFVLVVQNTNPPPSAPPAQSTLFRLVIRNQPVGDPSDTIAERASFEQFSLDPADGSTIPPFPTVEEEVEIPAGSAIARTVYVTSSDPRAAVRIDVQTLDAGGTVVETRAVFLNPDPSAPDNPLRPGNVDPQAPELDIERFEVHTLEIAEVGPDDIQDIGLTGGVPHQGPEDGTVDYGTPRWQNPRWQNDSWSAPRWQNPRWQNTAWSAPRWQNPRWQNFTISDADAANGSRHIRTEYTNVGNTTSSYDARVLVNALGVDRAFQLVVYKLDTSPPTDGCEAAQVAYTQVLVNLPDYDPSLLSFTDPSRAGEASFSLHPGETAFVELIVHATPSQPDPTTFDPATAVFAGTPQAVDTADIVPGQPVPEPEPTFSVPLFLAALELPDGEGGQPYPPTMLRSFGGEGPLVWSVVAGSLPAGMSLGAADGVLSGTPAPTASGTFAFTVQVMDATLQVATQSFSLNIAAPPPTQLAFDVQPASTSVGTILFPAVQVSVRDAFGNVVATASPFVTMGIGTNPGGGSLGGTTVVAAENGIGTFSDLAVDTPGAGYTLVASAEGLSSATSDPFNVQPIAGNLADAAGDSAGPDFLSASASVSGGNLHLGVRFVPGTFSSTTTLTTFSLDTDENAASGSPGVDSGCVNDAAALGTDYIVQMGSSFVGANAIVQTALGGCNQFGGAVVSGLITFLPDGMDVAIPLSQLGGDDGRLRFKATASTQVGPGTFTGVQDYISNVGLPPGQTK